MDEVKFEIREFTAADIPDALELCAQAGWNHIAPDWQRVLDLLPQACLGGFQGGRMVSTCTFTRFGKFGWVGAFLVDKALRGRGAGKAMFDTMLQRAAEAGIETLALDSSEAGRPIYLKKGFVLSGQGIELWTGNGTGAEDTGAAPLQAEHWAKLEAFDAETMRIDRSLQLRHLASESGASGRVLIERGSVKAFGFSRPGKMTGTIGPVVATGLAQAKKIIQSLLADRQRFDGQRPVGLAVHDKPELQQWLAECGFQMRRRNIRMFRPEIMDVCAGPHVFAATSLGMG